jgi:transposase
VLYWQLTQLGVHCDVIAPTLVPVKAGDRIKTDRRDALKLARSYRSGDLTAVWVPDEEHEALRDLMRAREVAKKDQLRARHRLHKFLLRRGLQPPEKIKTWTARHLDWVKTLRLEQPAQAATLLDYITEVEHAVQRIKRLECAIDQAVEAAPASIRAVIDGLQALRGVARISAATLVAELGQLSRFPRPKQLMGYTGAVPREHSSGAQVRRGAITKTGNAHLRRILVEAAWSYRHRPSLGGELLRRQKNASEEVREIAWKAQHRLHSRYARLAARGKLKQHIVTAVARELAGFVWAIGVEVERQIAGQRTRAA